MLNLIHRKDKLMPNKIKISTVFLDMDGVLSDFQQGVYAAFNEPYDYQKLPRAYDFWTTWSRDISREQVNAVCDTNFWANMPWTHDGKEILDAVFDKFLLEQIYLLTVPMPNVQSPTGKWMWIKKNIPELYDRTLIGPVPKDLFAKPNTLLIDDHDKYGDAFRAAGGKVIRVPRPWNCLYPWSDCALEVVKLSLRRFESAT